MTDHPNPGNRTEYVNEEIDTLPRLPHPMVNSAAFQRAHDLALQEKTFTAQQIKDGVWKSGNFAAGPGQTPAGVGLQAVSPSSPAQYGAQGPVALGLSQLGIGGNLIQYQGGNFRISYPPSWQISDAGKQGATLAPPGGFGTFGVVYGAIVGTVEGNGAILDEDSLANATTQLAQRLSQLNGGLQQVGGPQNAKLDGQPAITLELHGRSPLVENGSTLAERDWLVTMASRDGDLHYIVFVSPGA